MASNPDAYDTPWTGRGQRTKKPSARMQDLLRGYDGLVSDPSSSLSTAGLKCGSGSSSIDSTAPNSESSVLHIKDRSKANTMVTPHEQAANFPSRHLYPFTLPSFDAKCFAIQDWLRPKPIDYVDLSQATRKWKDKEDRNDPLIMIDDGSANWCEFAGRGDLYPNGNANHEREYCIARNFVVRARRAHQQGVSWQDFEREEMTIDSEASARGERDPRRQAIMMSEALNNKLRLAVFRQIKGRLCNEIWGQHAVSYPVQQ